MFMNPTGNCMVYEEGIYKTYMLYSLQAGYAYNVRLNTISNCTSSPTVLPKIVVNSIKTVNFTDIKGNYLNGIYSSSQLQDTRE